MDPTDPGKVTFRDAINMSNATPGPNTITFAISPGGEQTINLTSPLPALTQPVEIYGGTQTNSKFVTPGIILNGSGAGSGDGFDVVAGNSTIEGFVIEYFSGHGVVLKTAGKDEVINDCIGTNAAHDGAAPNNLDGVLINNVGNNAVQECIISGNIQNGIEVTGVNATNNLIGTGSTANANVGTSQGYGNYIGVDYDASGAIPNQLDGILIHGAASVTTVADNIISGNDGNGVHITGTGAVPAGTGTTGNILVGNYIGTDYSGTQPLGNGGDGILIDGGANDNMIGSGAVLDRNLISDNLNGVHITGTGAVAAGTSTTGNTLLGNYIGTDITGKNSLGNQDDGVLIDNGANGNNIGSSAAGGGNLISGNDGTSGNGVHINGSNLTVIAGQVGTWNNTVVGNMIGIESDGKTALANTHDGVLIDAGASNNNIGTSGTAAAINTISGNGQNGIEINGSGCTGNKVQNCYIGTDVMGKTAVENGNDGVLIQGAPGNFIGGTNELTMKLVQGNLISGNFSDGIEISGANASSNYVRGNYIGTTYDSKSPLGNGDEGVDVLGAPNTVIGSTPTDVPAGDYRNVISDNGDNGVWIDGSGASNAMVGGNYIGTDITGKIELGNTADGVLISDAAGTSVKGTNTTLGAIISGNGANGVEISGSDVMNTTIQNIAIGVDVSTTIAFANGSDGVLIDNGSTNTVTQCVISGNGMNGVHIMGADATGNMVNLCQIGIKGDNSGPLQNGNDGVLIEGGATGNFIGNGKTGNNTISGNKVNGVEISGDGTDGNFVQGNFIGTNFNGMTAVQNGQHGVMIDNNASNNTIGGATTQPGQGIGNVISGNKMNGVDIEDLLTTGNIVQGNLIGTQATGSGKLPNMNDGVFIGNDAFGNFIGLAGLGDYNIISGNGVNGIEINGTLTTLNVVQNNVIGSDSNAVADANGNDGVLVNNGANNNDIGEVGGTLYNIISGNTGHGVELNGAGTSFNTVQNNFIGLDGSDTAKTPNQHDGVLITNGATNNDIGLPGAGNTISGNVMNGVEINGAATLGNTVAANAIGTNPAGAAGLGNTLDGVLLNGVGTNTIGMAVAGGDNVISGNGMNGVHLESGATGNVVQNNYIGSNNSGTVALANSGSGVYVEGSSNNTIGGAAPPADNSIEFNGKNGVTIASGTGNRIEQNSIFMNGLLGIDLDNNGVTLNTPGGPHTGANHDQNYPVIQSANFQGPLGTSVGLTLNSTPNTRFTVELFDSPVGNASRYGEGKIYLGSVPVTTDRNGNATAMLNVQGAPAGSVLTATATDIQTNIGDTSEFSADETVMDGFPPTVDNVTFVYSKTKVTGVEISFNEALNASTVNATNFELFSAGAHNAFTTLIPLAKTNPIQYNSTTDTVTLITAKPLAASQFIKVYVNGTKNPVTDQAGTALDGEFTTTLPSGNGVPGGDFDALVAFGTRFSYADSHSNAVAISLSHGGSMEIIRTLNGEGRYLELANVIAGKTILSGTVTKGKTGNGVTTLQGITGLGNAIDKLPPTEFTVLNSMLPPLDILPSAESGLLAPWLDEISP
jgi:hypothetical protein